MLSSRIISGSNPFFEKLTLASLQQFRPDHRRGNGFNDGVSNACGWQNQSASSSGVDMNSYCFQKRLLMLVKSTQLNVIIVNWWSIFIQNWCISDVHKLLKSAYRSCPVLRELLLLILLFGIFNILLYCSSITSRRLPRQDLHLVPPLLSTIKSCFCYSRRLLWN